MTGASWRVGPWRLRLKSAQSIKGFTIVEVMIALAISTAMLVAGIAVFNNRRQDTEFDQAVYDLQSKLSSYVNIVSTKALPGYQSYHCGLVSGRPQLTAGSGGTSEDCIFMGQAVAVSPSSGTITAYPVFGTRLNSLGALSSTLADSNPTPALPLAQDYILPGGLKVLCASTDNDPCSGVPAASEQDILAIYSTLQSSNISGNETTANSYAAQVNSGNKVTQVTNCVEQAASCNSGYIDLSDKIWHLCVSDNRRSARVNVKGSSVGTVISVTMDSCA